MKGLILIKLITVKNAQCVTTGILRVWILKSVCNGCRDLVMLGLDISDITIMTFKGIDYCSIVSVICRSSAFDLLENEDDDDDYDNELFLWYGWPTKGI